MSHSTILYGLFSFIPIHSLVSSFGGCNLVKYGKNTIELILLIFEWNGGNLFIFSHESESVLFPSTTTAYFGALHPCVSKSIE